MPFDECRSKALICIDDNFYAKMRATATSHRWMYKHMSSTRITSLEYITHIDGVSALTKLIRKESSPRRFRVNKTVVSFKGGYMASIPVTTWSWSKSEHLLLVNTLVVVRPTTSILIHIKLCLKKEESMYRRSILIVPKMSTSPR